MAPPPCRGGDLQAGRRGQLRLTRLLRGAQRRRPQRRARAGVQVGRDQTVWQEPRRRLRHHRRGLRPRVQGDVRPSAHAAQG
eukprot:964982-Pyramimonas_sp.AAC.1